MIKLENIQELVGNHVAPYIYNAKNFTPGITPIYYSGPYWDNKETEAAMGPAAQAEQDPTQLSYVSAGGFSAGRMKQYDYIGN